MIDAYVINLEKDIQRKETMLKNIKDYQVDQMINFNIIRAVDKSSFDEYKFKICDTWFDRILRTGITTGEVGCSLSHYKCWNEFYNSNKKHALFFEDDISFAPDFRDKLQILLEYPPDADIVYIHRKPLKRDQETQYNDNFINIRASYWACGYLLTRNGVKKLLKTNFLHNLIVVDEFLPLLYDPTYLSEYFKYYNHIKLIGYSMSRSFIRLTDETFTQSNTFHSNYFKYNNQRLIITSDLNVSMSSINRFIYSCEKYSLNHMVVNNAMDVIRMLKNIDDHKILIICDCRFSFFIGNPLELFLKNEDFVYSNVNNLKEFVSAYSNGTAFFYGKKYIFEHIVNILNINMSNESKDTYNLKNNEFIKTLSADDTDVSANSIIVNGRDNIKLLNKYENYVLNKVYKSYGFKLNNNLCNFAFKIRINILIFDLNYKQSIKNLKKIDYPSNLIDIHIYTNQQLIIQDNYPIHRMNIFDAYKDIYNHYTNYDYIWIIISKYIITDFSLLKNCISANKNIVSGLQKSKKTLLSNFWSDYTETGWYKRSDDYLDIYNRTLINLWNVPYLYGNMLINTKILNMYDIFKVINYDKHNIDMILCENLRLIGEGMYLLNDREYGYICDNYNNFSNWSEESILHEDFYDFIYNGRTDIFNEVGPDIWNIPFFSPEFCNYLIDRAEKMGNWSKGVFGDREIDKRINGIENVPTQDIHLNDLKLHDFWKNVVKDYFSKILSYLYKYVVKDYNIAFIVKYDYLNGQKSLSPHHDASNYTINIALNSSDEYTGGGVNFISRKCFFLNKIPGYLLLHPGRITHYHEALPITSGKRYVLVSFNN